MESGIKLNFYITIPEKPARLFVTLALLYRRARYGYAFRRIPLTQGKYAIVDPDDFERLKANLRLATCAQNTYNRRCFRKDKSSKYKGLSWRKQRKIWAVTICYKRKNIIIGYFKDEIQAAKAYDKAAKKYHGEFASSNFKE